MVHNIEDIAGSTSIEISEYEKGLKFGISRVHTFYIGALRTKYIVFVCILGGQCLHSRSKETNCRHPVDLCLNYLNLGGWAHHSLASSVIYKLPSNLTRNWHPGLKEVIISCAQLWKHLDCIQSPLIRHFQNKLMAWQ